MPPGPAGRAATSSSNEPLHSLSVIRTIQSWQTKVRSQELAVFDSGQQPCVTPLPFINNLFGVTLIPVRLRAGILQAGTASAHGGYSCAGRLRSTTRWRFPNRPPSAAPSERLRPRWEMLQLPGSARPPRRRPERALSLDTHTDNGVFRRDLHDCKGGPGPNPARARAPLQPLEPPPMERLTGTYAS